MAPEIWPPMFECCMNSPNKADVEHGVNSDKAVVEDIPTTTVDNLLMPQSMMDTWFSRIRRQFRDVERNSRGTSPTSRHTMKDFLDISQQLETILLKEKAAVFRSYRRSQECVHHNNDGRNPPGTTD